MTRIKIKLPEAFQFKTVIPIRITDVNYAGHVGNDSILSIIHEARIQFFDSIGHSELNLGGIGTIMSNVVIEYKNELFYGNSIIVSVAVADISKVGFDLLYKLEKESDGKKILIAAARTGIVCFDYKKKKIASIPDDVKKVLID